MEWLVAEVTGTRTALKVYGTNSEFYYNVLASMSLLWACYYSLISLWIHDLSLQNHRTIKEPNIDLLASVERSEHSR